MWQIVPGKNLTATLEEFFSLVAVAADPDGFREELVSSHADQGSNFVERHVVPSFPKRVHPRLCVSVVAVYERAVDVKDYAFEQSLLQRLLDRFCLVEMTLNYRRGFLNQVLELRGLCLCGCFRCQVENGLVRIDFGIDVSLVEILALGCRIERVGLLLRHAWHRIVRRSRRSHVQLLGECCALCAELVMVAHHPSGEISHCGCGSLGRRNSAR